MALKLSAPIGGVSGSEDYTDHVVPLLWSRLKRGVAILLASAGRWQTSPDHCPPLCVLIRISL
ncbi:hypothetical protein MVUOKPPV_CDS0132 [Klebsiella phage phi1_175008]|uniref:Uncharacterized protein n=1 Tax=Klebsiella phage phi1_175008 TaxID=3127744 RepID=A0ACD5FR31_9CAUD